MMQSMDEIYQKYAQTVYKYLMSLTHDQEVSEELAQETFFQAIRAIDRFDGRCAVSTWLCGIAKNVLYTYRRKYPQQESIEEWDEKTYSAEREVLESLERVELLKRLHACPEPYREILYLRLFGNLSFKEIGEVFGKTENWARVSFYRGKEKLRKDCEKI